MPNRMKALSLKLSLALLCGLALTACATTVIPPGRLQNTPISEADILVQAKADVAALASDSLAGRGYLYGGTAKAARYLRQRFKSIGLQPVNGSYYQPFALTTDLFPEAPELTVNGRSLRLGRDFLPLPSSASGITKGRESVVRAGSGVVLPEVGVNAYEDVDVDGAVVVLDEVVPDTLRSLARDTPETVTEEGRVQAARERGAASVVFLTDRLIYGASFENAGLPAFYVRQDAWPDLVRSVSYRVRSIQDTTVQTQNVLGWLPGTVAPDSFLIVMAHYDHLGALGREVYFPGANDNASGVALLLALAETLSEQSLRYSVLFVAFSGEEAGLIGSHYFTEHPPVDLDRAVFLVNFDMVASGEDGVVVEGGIDFPDRYQLLRRVGGGIRGLEISARRNAPNSDQFFLIRRGIPGFYLYTNRGKQPYHSIADVPSTLEWDDFLQVYELASGFVRRVDDAP
ncbi:MAG TPA: M28 family peptidase [Rhodothermales bacterium]|nr:M28 family peptidase [Rhodothermales bacterium]